MKDNPAPGSYFDTGYDSRNRGPTFGISHKHYEKVMIPREKKPQNQVSRSKYPLNIELSPIRDPTMRDQTGK